MTYSRNSAAAGIAADIRDARPLVGRLRSADIGEAYALQDEVTTRLVSDGVRRNVAGYKIAANSRGAMQMFGVSEPASARLFADQVFQSAATIELSAFRTFAYEPEIAAIMRNGLDPRDSPYTEEDVLAAIDRFVPAFELLDLRNADLGAIGLAEAIAQNISNAGVVIGGPGVAARDLDIEAMETTVEIDSTTELSVKSAAPQPPLAAATWMANHLSRRGLSLEAGHVVLCGSHAPIRPVAGPAIIRLRISNLGDAAIELR